MADSPQSKKPKSNWYPFWAPRFWHGMRVLDYLSLLRQNRFNIHPARYPMTALVGFSSTLNSILSGIQRLAYSRKIQTTELTQPPVFVIGHWRSGTTMMHELLALDQQFAYPSNVETFLPHHFLVSGRLTGPMINLLLPKKRPMDNMQIAGRSPQEDDFALCALGAPTPYRRIAFPNRQGRDHMALNLGLAAPKLQLELRDALQLFLKTMTLRFDKQLVLKSPPHTGRITQLATWFPDAKFVHISRHPYKLVPSTMRLWKLLDQLQAFQLPRYDDTALKSYVFECQDLMYTGYFEGRQHLKSNQLAEIKFEDLVANPVEQMQTVYQQLELGDFDSAKPGIENYFEQRAGHKTNQLSMDETLRQDIDSHWRVYMREFGYESGEPIL